MAVFSVRCRSMGYWGCCELREDYHITEKRQDFNLLERLSQVIAEVLVSAGREWPARENPGRQAEV
jgi:hypothetical protein